MLDLEQNNIGRPKEGNCSPRSLVVEKLLPAGEYISPKDWIQKGSGIVRTSEEALLFLADSYIC